MTMFRFLQTRRRVHKEGSASDAAREPRLGDSVGTTSELRLDFLVSLSFSLSFLLSIFLPFFLTLLLVLSRCSSLWTSGLSNWTFVPIKATGLLLLGLAMV